MAQRKEESSAKERSAMMQWGTPTPSRISKAWHVAMEDKEIQTPTTDERKDLL